jgi:hypothetical protein
MITSSVNPCCIRMIYDSVFFYSISEREDITEPSHGHGDQEEFRLAILRQAISSHWQTRTCTGNGYVALLFWRKLGPVSNQSPVRARGLAR